MIINKIIATIMLILFTAFSSGGVVFAFECCDDEHYHFSMFSETTCCGDDATDEDCDCHKCDNLNTNLHKCELKFVKALALNIGIDLNINENNIKYICIEKNLYYHNSNANYTYLLSLCSNKCPNAKYLKPPDIKRFLVDYIRTISSKNDEPPLAN
jgi:hypothetical protein